MLRIIRSKRKTLSLTVTKEGEVLVRAPYGVSERYIAEFVAKHRGWIEKRTVARRTASTLSLSDGNTVCLFGSAYEIRTGRKGGISGNLIYLPEEDRKQALTAVLKAFSSEVMKSFTQALAARHGFVFSGIRISSARGRWGSCNRNKAVAYSFRIAFLPPDLCEYVAIHELAHTVYFDHSQAFWRTVERALPDWKERRKRLRDCGYIMDYL